MIKQSSLEIALENLDISINQINCNPVYENNFKDVIKSIFEKLLVLWKNMISKIRSWWRKLNIRISELLIKIINWRKNKNSIFESNIDTNPITDRIEQKAIIEWRRDIISKINQLENLIKNPLNDTLKNLMSHSRTILMEYENLNRSSFDALESEKLDKILERLQKIETDSERIAKENNLVRDLVTRTNRTHARFTSYNFLDSKEIEDALRRLIVCQKTVDKMLYEIDKTYIKMIEKGILNSGNPDLNHQGYINACKTARYIAKRIFGIASENAKVILLHIYSIQTTKNREIT